MTRYLLDTNVVSEPIRLLPQDNVIQRFRLHRDECVLASVVWHELWFGCFQLPVSRRRSKIEIYLAEVIQPSFPILPYDAQSAAWYAEERARLKAIGLTPPYVDGQIAAIAAVNGLILVTHNVADYRHFAGLQIEDWRTPLA